MKIGFTWLLPMLVGLCLTCAPVVWVSEVHAQSLDSQAHDAVEAGNRALEAGDNKKAIEHYEHAETLAPNAYEPIYNKAVAQMREGEYDTAAVTFNQALKSPDPSLRAKARYNLGNMQYERALTLEKEDPQLMRTPLTQALDQYRQALQDDREMIDARANLEMAARLLRDLKEPTSSETPEESEEEENNQEEGGSGQGDDGQANEDQSQQPTNEQNDQDPEEGENEGESGETPENNEDNSDQNPDSNEEGAEQEGDQEQGEPDESDKSEPENEGERQNEGDEDGQGGKTGNNGEEEDPNSEPSNDGNGETPEDQDQNEENPDQEADDSSSDSAINPTEQMSQEEAERLLKRIRDRDLQRRRQQADQRARTYQPNEKDW